MPAKPKTGNVTLKTAAEAKKTAIKKMPSKTTLARKPKAEPAEKVTSAKKTAVKKAPAKSKAAPKSKK